MGFRFRKSINLGGFRINLSKSGIGYSFGIPGARYTKKASGGHRTTLSIPGTGISYVKDSKKANINKKPTTNRNDNSNNKEIIYSEVIDSTPNQLIDKMNEATKKNQLLLIMKVLCGFIAFIALGFLYGAITEIYHIAVGIVSSIVMLGALVALLFIPKSALIDLNYTFGNCEKEKKFNNILSAVKGLKNSERVWELSAANIHNDWKNHAGASATVDRKIIKIENAKLFSSEYELQSISVQDKKIVFLPDIIAVFQNGKWVAIEWHKFKIESDTTIFMEANNVPTDAFILGHTYLHPNKDGSPDKRYANNPQIAKCLYSIIGLESLNGLEIILMVSNQNNADKFYNAITEFKLTNSF